MKKDEKEQTTNIPWVITDPRAPVIQSGHMENRRADSAR